MGETTNLNWLAGFLNHQDNGFQLEKKKAEKYNNKALAYDVYMPLKVSVTHPSTPENLATPPHVDAPWRPNQRTMTITVVQNPFTMR